MQLGLVQVLLGQGLPASGTPGDAANGDLFSQLLGDASAQGGNDQAASGMLAGDVAAGALVAQELDTTQLATLPQLDATAVTQLLTTPIGPQEARSLLNQMDNMHFSDQGSQEAFDQLKETLESIEASGEPVAVSDILDQLPAVQEQAENPAQRAPLMQRMLGWMQHALPKQKEASQQAAVAPAVMPDATTQSLQASVFRTAEPAPTPATPQAERDTSTAQETADLTATAPQTTPVIIATMPEWVRKLGEDNVPAHTEEAIPSLTLAEDNALPELTLPRLNEAEDSMAAASATPAKEVASTPATPAFSEHLKALPDQLTADDAGSAPITQVDATGVGQAQGSSQVATSHSSMTVQTHSALSHVAPHTAAAEQVHVAITTATRDGLDTITLQMEPAELGRVEVKMETGLDGRTQLSFMVDKAETLDALSRDARSLERSLQEAGIKADAGSMQFNLRQQPQFSDSSDGKSARGNAANDNDQISALAPASGITHHYTINVREGVDIHA